MSYSMSYQYRRRIVAMVLIIRFIDAFAVGAMVPILPVLAVSFGLNMTEATMVGAIFPFFLMLASPVLGRLSDRVGRKLVVISALLAGLMSYAIMCWEPSLIMLLISRSLSGLAAASSTAAGAILADISPPNEGAIHNSAPNVVYGRDHVRAGPWSFSGSIEPFDSVSDIERLGLCRLNVRSDAARN